MPFKKVGKDDYTSPGGRHFNTAQVKLYHAHGNSFPGQEAKVKGSGPKTASYAQGGEVLGRTKDFMKTPDRFRDSQFVKKTEDVWGKGESAANPKAKDKSLKAVKPRG
jgi:hypothetical protein